MTRQTKPAKAPKPVKAETAWAVIGENGRIARSVPNHLSIYALPKYSMKACFRGMRLELVEIRVLGGKK